MRKIFRKAISVVTAVAMTATLMTGANFAKATEVKAEETEVKLTPWAFYQAGSFGASHDSGLATYSSVTTTAGETKSGNDFQQDGERTVKTKTAADGFTAVIKSNGWGADYTNNTFNPWQITTKMNAITIEPGHDYEITFKARASQQKYAYFTIGSEFEGEPKLEGDPFMVISKDSQEYKYAFTNWAESKTLDIQIMLGAFNAFYVDYAGIDRSEQMKDGFESNWAGTLYVSEFKIIDKGVNPNAKPKYDGKHKPVKVNNPKTVAHAANGANVANGKVWSSFSVCTREDGGTWEDALKKIVKKDNDGNEVKDEKGNKVYFTKGIDYGTEGWITNDYTNSELTASTVKGGFRYYVASTGWDGEYNPYTNKLVGDNPWGLTATLTNIPVEAGRYYSISFQIKSTLKNDATTMKHILFKAYDPVSPGEPGVEFKSISGPSATTSGYMALDSAKGWQTVTATIQIPASKTQYAAKIVGIKFALGSNIITYPDEIGMSGDILVKDFKITAGTQYAVKYTNSATKKSVTKYVNKGAKASSYAFTRKGYTLSGYKNAATGKTYNFNTTVKGNLNLTTVWKKTAKPGRPTIKKCDNKKKKKVTVTLKKKVKNAVGYQIQYSNKKNMKKAKTKSTSKTKYTLTKLNSRKYVYIRVRAYVKDSAGNKVYGNYSKKKKVYVR